jgi:hypothetical protein
VRSRGQTGTGDAVIVFFKLPDLMFNRGTNSIRRSASFEGQLQGDLHNVLSASENAVSIARIFQSSKTIPLAHFRGRETRVLFWNPAAILDWSFAVESAAR